MEFGSEILDAVECEENDPGPCNTIKYINLEFKKSISYINENENIINKEIILFYMWFDIIIIYHKWYLCWLLQISIWGKESKVEQASIIERYNEKNRFQIKKPK